MGQRGMQRPYLVPGRLESALAAGTITPAQYQNWMGMLGKTKLTPQQIQGMAEDVPIEPRLLGLNESWADEPFGLLQRR